MSKKYIQCFVISLLLIFHSQSCIQATSVMDYVAMAYAYFKNPYSVGELVPLSDTAGRYLTKFISKQNVAKRYLEVGAGYGAITEHIIKKMDQSDQLDVIEIDPIMCQKLQTKFAQYSNVVIHCCSILDWHPDYNYDAIISTLPFNSFQVFFAKQVIELYISLASHACVVSYVEYDIVDTFLKYFYTAKGRQAHDEVQQYLTKMRNKNLLEEKIIYKNVPSLKIYHLRF